MLAGQHSIDALFHQPLARPSNCVDAGLQGCGNLAVTPGFAGVRRIRLQQNARFQLLPRRVFALGDQRGQPAPLLIAELHHVFFYRDLFGSHKSSPLVLCGTIESDIHRRVKDAGH